MNTEERFLRLRDVLAMYPVSKSVWYDGIKRGVYPAPVRLSERTTAWRLTDIRALIERISSGIAAA